jgi:hypothetical protein
VSEASAAIESTGWIFRQGDGQHFIEGTKTRSQIDQLGRGRIEVAAYHHCGIAMREKMGPGQKVIGSGG